ncbi:beta-galactosidase 8 isoform X2 [Cryptomeria japonica]|uniref:beta-galactosidase 8 isoform X2 n=1 Tax=Cryptomeria japonica TaxID=3369 RepID=UPI0027DA2E78|nr:beta-galactosidase 8 isoform X2 [Cryptomeria japonica]
MAILRALWPVLLVVFCLFNSNSVNANTTVSYDGRALLINGQRKMWPDLIAKSKAGGLDVIETYVFWNMHEPERRQYNFKGRNDLVRFLKTIQAAGLYAHLRIGPYACAEWNYGGFPVWLHSIQGIQMRTDNEPFKNEMTIFTTKIVEMMKAEKLFAWQGGPIILGQIENEYGNQEKHYGEKGKAYINWVAKMAEAQNINLPWVMCQQEDAPDPIINACNGFYCDSFEPNSMKKPKMWTENWSGWFLTFGGRVPHRPTEDVAFAVARFYQRGGTFQNYYMYHGGTNFGRTAGGPFISTSYDYDAPIDEYGYIRQPKWGHLKELHHAIKQSEAALVNGEMHSISFGHDLQATVYSVNSSGICAAFLSNTHPRKDATVQFNGKSYYLPAWSVSILPDCKHAVFNTAKISTQTSSMAMEKVGLESLLPAETETSSSDTKPSINWSWHKEPIGIRSGENFSSNGLLEQLYTAKDKSDFLWYTNSVHLDEDEPFLKNKSQVYLHVKTRGHALHVFINGQFAGTQWGSYNNTSFTMHIPITLKAGTNEIDLLSVTVGWQNYGPFFDTWEAGINGPVMLLGLKNGTKDLTFQKWNYQIGLNGEHQRLYSKTGANAVQWNSGTYPPNTTALIWYRTEFNAPKGNNAVALDLTTMSKGQAWVNGHHIGRYFPSFKAPTDGCSDTCDYRGTYSPTNCVTGCGKSSQEWYHVPRSWLHPTNNVLVLLEEIGGDPSGISFRTRYVDTICSHVSQDDPTAYYSVEESHGVTEPPHLNLQCSSGQHISAIKFASFGNPKGSCGTFYEGSCHATTSSDIIRKACVGYEECSIPVSEALFGKPCDDLVKSLAVEAICSH